MQQIKKTNFLLVHFISKGIIKITIENTIAQSIIVLLLSCIFDIHIVTCAKFKQI